MNNPEIKPLPERISGPSLIRPLVFAGSVAVLVIIGTVLAQIYIWNHALKTTASARTESIRQDAFLLSLRLRGRANDFFFLKSVAEDEIARDPSVSTTNDFDLRNAIKTMMLTRSQFDKISLLDSEGREILRYNWVGGKNPIQEVFSAEFQNKSKRPFFRETLAAPSNAAVYSPFELTEENDQIVKPYRPVIRVSGQILSPNGALRAILVMNYQGEPMVQNLKAHGENHQGLLLNPDGYWLVGPTAGSEWAFMFPDRKNESLAFQDRTLWTKIKSEESGWIEYKDSLYVFQNLDPVNAKLDYSPLRVPVVGGDRLKWTLIQKTPDAVILQGVEGERVGIFILGGGAIVLFAPLSWLITSNSQRRHRDRVAVREARDLLTSVNEVSQHGLILFEAIRDQTGTIVDFSLVLNNRAANEILGRNLDALKAEGRTLLQARKGAASDGSFDHYAQVIETGNPVAFEFLYKFEAIERWLSVRVAKRLDGAVVTFSDVTAKKKAEEELRNITSRALAAERAKSEFLAVMSHEIRTPMNGVIGMTSLLADTQLNETQKDYVQTIHHSGEALLTVINDILDFSKIESGKVILEERPFDLRQCIEEVIQLFVARIREKKLETVYFIAPNVPTNLVGDDVRVRQILTNLLSNAVKFTERGEIVIRVETDGSDEAGCHLRFSVADSGIGIPPEAINKLFQSFHQVDASTTRRYGGTGLGLAISKRLAELMKGSMWVESQPGVGSNFFFTAVLPAAALSGAVATGPLRIFTKSFRALVVDDNATNRFVLESQLKNWRISVACAASGEEALRLLQDEMFDFFLLDLQMPGMDGIALASEIRKITSAPLILLSSSAEMDDQRIKELFRFHIPKPIRQMQLWEALQTLTGGAAAGVPSKPSVKRFDPTMASRRPLNILIAEDNVVNQKVGRTMLRNFGYEADIACDGLEVLKAVEAKSYDLILMDIQMPDMDGVEAMQHLRKAYQGEGPRIVALTANALPGDREKYLKMGFDDYLSKPLNPELLEAAIAATATLVPTNH